MRPSRRGEGHASRALGLALHRSVELGLDRVLVTCDEENRPSARTIERNGGVLEDVRNGTRRYWIDTRAAESALKLGSVAPALLLEGARKPEVRNSHLQYAVFWFVMALIAGVMLLMLSRRDDR